MSGAAERLAALGLTLPPVATNPTRFPRSASFSFKAAASPAAPAPSTTLCVSVK